MFPVALDLTKVLVLLAGNGDLLLKRLAYLDEDRAEKVTVYCDQPSEALRRAAGDRLVERLPQPGDVQAATVILLAGLDRATSERIAGWARAVGKLVNVEDVNDLCDFYYTANIRRGDLLIAVSTSGASPTLARKVRDWLAQRFGGEWEGRTREMKQLRQQWKAQGAGFNELIRRSESFLAEKGWLKPDKDAA